MAKIVSLGSALQDIYLIDHDDLSPTAIGDEAIFGNILVGSKVDIDQLSYEIGGGGVNSSITFARHGHEAFLITNIARDAAGEAILHVLEREKVNSGYINIINRKATGTSVILLDAKRGERTILTHRGASEKFDNFNAADLTSLKPDYLYVTTLRGDLDTIAKFFKKARELSIKIMFNPGIKELKKPKELARLFEYVDILLVNKSEASKIVPGVVLTELLYHLNNYVPVVIITDGAMGGIAGNRKTEEIYRFGIYEDVKMKDATGAGDAFGSGFLAALLEGKSFRSSIIFASANSTSVVTKIGANKGILTGHEELHPMPIQKI
ncbi:MAG: carbohydrate kinase family protein [Alphaproteobacteria bacterium]|nr:carbohydrate kinase family protein [Alphaproteobacteria bacterium]